MAGRSRGRSINGAIMAPPIIDLSGQRVGRLTVIRATTERIGRCVIWECLCDCGNTTLVSVQNLRRGSTHSCGCWKAECHTTHGYAPRHGHTPTYRSWYAMVKRCTKPSSARYYRYGAIGVKVCRRWLKFENFLADMGERPDGTTLGRYKDRGDYKPSNCAWMTRADQEIQRKLNRMNHG